MVEPESLELPVSLLDEPESVSLVDMVVDAVVVPSPLDDESALALLSAVVVLVVAESPLVLASVSESESDADVAEVSSPGHAASSVAIMTIEVGCRNNARYVMGLATLA
ncbi:MAG: hypothetical protein U0168_07875 [Nannocystaceae bacterium]